MAGRIVSINMPIPHIWRVWGIASLSLLGSFHNLLEDIRNNLTLSLFILITLGVGWTLISMFTYQQALNELANNPFLRDLVEKMAKKLDQDPLYSLGGMTDYITTLIMDEEENRARLKVRTSGIWSIDVDWDKIDFTYYQMAYKIICVQRYGHSEFWSAEDFNNEYQTLKDKCKVNYNIRLKTDNEQK